MRGEVTPTNGRVSPRDRTRGFVVADPGLVRHYRMSWGARGDSNDLWWRHRTVAATMVEWMKCSPLERRGRGRGDGHALPHFGIALLMVAVLLPALAALAAQLYQGVQCVWGGRSGWIVEFPTSSVTEDKFRCTVRSQTACADLTVRRVNTDGVPDGFVVRPVGARTWVGIGDSIEVLVEAEPGPGVIECGQPIRDAGQGQATEVLTCPGEPTPPG